MKYGKIDYVNKPVSRIFYGSACQPFLSGGDGTEILDAVFNLGVTSIDCARNYQKAEVSLGNWMELRGNREELVILSKCGHHDSDGRKRVNEKEMWEDLECSLQKLKTDYIDIYLLHRDDKKTPVSEVMETFNAMKAAGKICAFGASNWTYERIAEANEYAYKKGLQPMSISSPHFGLAEQVTDPWGGGCETITGNAQEKARAWYGCNQMPILAYSSLGRGFFSGKLTYDQKERVSEILDPVAVKGYVSEENFEKLRRCEKLAEEKGVTVAQLAMAWNFRQELDVYAVVSTVNPERMKANIEALDLVLTKEECRYLNQKS